MYRHVAILPLLSAAASAASIANLTTTGCVDASGLESCMAQVATDSEACIKVARENNSDLEVLGCGCVYHSANINCYAAHCWNRVYECEYQMYGAAYFNECLSAKLPIPYFPAPDNAPDACSCNLGKVFKNFNGAVLAGAACVKDASGFGKRDFFETVDKEVTCECCELSGGLSSIYETCPDTDPKYAGIAYFSQLESMYGQPFSECGKYLATANCEKVLGFTGISSFIQPTNIPASGTATLSNGPGTVTSPASGDVFSYTNVGDNRVYTISAASATQDSGNGGSGGSGGSSGSASTAAAGDAKGKSGSGASQIAIGWAVWAVPGLVLVVRNWV